MRTYSLLSNLLGIGCLLSSCSAPKSDNQAVKTAYIHRYGVQVINEKDFMARGGTGEVVDRLKNGATLRKPYVDGKLHGKACTTFPHSEIIQFVQVYNRGNLIEEIENYDSGVPMCKTVFSKAGSEKTYWYTDGSPRATEHIKNSSIVKGEYFTPLFELEASLDKGSGIKVTRSPTGVLVKKETYVNNEKTLEIGYHPNGVISEEISFVHGIAEGIKKTYAQNGAPQTVEEYKGGMRHGAVVVFVDGQKVARVPYMHNKKHGIEVRFKPGTEDVITEISWKNGQQHGPQVNFVDNVRVTDWFYEGAKISKGEYVDREAHEGPNA